MHGQTNIKFIHEIRKRPEMRTGIIFKMLH